jgi:hypothetical protein
MFRSRLSSDFSDSVNGTMDSPSPERVKGPVLPPSAVARSEMATPTRVTGRHLGFADRQPFQTVHSPAQRNRSGGVSFGPLHRSVQNTELVP